jgi:hypothetical protein
MGGLKLKKRALDCHFFIYFTETIFKEFNMKTSSFFNLAFLSLAFSLFTACGSDDGGDATPSINSLLPKHLYLDISLQGKNPGEGAKYEGDGIINIHVGLCETAAVLPAGTIKNGEITWDIPEISDEYLKPIPIVCDGSDVTTAISNPNNLKSTGVHFGAVLPSGYGSVCLSLKDSGKSNPDRNLEYYSGKGEIKGSVVWDKDDAVFYDLKISKGWNIITTTGDKFSISITTDPTPLIGELVLWENCTWK